MSEIHKNLLEKSIRYDSYLKIDTIIKLEQICEAHGKEPSQMIAFILKIYYKKDEKLKIQKAKIKELKSRYKQGLLF